MFDRRRAAYVAGLFTVFFACAGFVAQRTWNRPADEQKSAEHGRRITVHGTSAGVTTSDWAEGLTRTPNTPTVSYIMVVMTDDGIEVQCRFRPVSRGDPTPFPSGGRVSVRGTAVYSGPGYLILDDCDPPSR